MNTERDYFPNNNGFTINMGANGIPNINTTSTNNTIPRGIGNIGSNNIGGIISGNTGGTKIGGANGVNTTPTNNSGATAPQIKLPKVRTAEEQEATYKKMSEAMGFPYYTPEERRAAEEEAAKIRGWNPDEMTLDEWYESGGIQKAEEAAIAQGWNPEEEPYEDWAARNNQEQTVDNSGDASNGGESSDAGVSEEVDSAEGEPQNTESSDNTDSRPAVVQKPNRGARPGNATTMSAKSGFNIELDHNELERNRKQLAAGAAEMTRVWNDIVNNDISRVEGMWTSNDGKQYVSKIRSFDAKVSAANEALNYLSNTFASADSRLMETQAEVTKDINNL